jgi:hypothetical protein
VKKEVAQIRAKKFLLRAYTEAGFEIITEKTAEIFVLQNKNEGQNCNGRMDNKSSLNVTNFKVAGDATVRIMN